MKHWKAWVFAVVMAVTLVLLWKAISNIRSTAELELTPAEFDEYAEEGDLASVRYDMDGSISGWLQSGEFFHVSEIVDRRALIERLETEGVEVQTVESRWAEFVENSWPGILLLLLNVSLLVRWIRTR